MVADHRDADGPGVEAGRVRADDAAVDTAEPTLVDDPVTVDEEVVAVVAVAATLDVIDVDPAHGRSGLRGGVVFVVAVWCRTTTFGSA